MGTRGGCYNLTESGGKKYVDKKYCSEITNPTDEPEEKESKEAKEKPAEKPDEKPAEKPS